MKKSIIVLQALSLSLLVFLAACKQGGTDSGKGLYGVKSGIVTYKPMDMMGMKVTQTLYFDDYGNKEARETFSEASMMDITMKSHMMDIRDGKTTYHYEIENSQNGVNQAEKKAIKSMLDDELMKQLNLANLPEEFKKRFDYKEEGTEEVAGYKGTKYSVAPDSTNPAMRITGVHYMNLPLKVTMAGMEIVAEKVELNAKVPADKFVVPADYQIIEDNMNMPLMEPRDSLQQEPYEKEAAKPSR